MDKLELDARVAHLERKVAILGAIIAVMAAAAILSVITLTRSSVTHISSPQPVPPRLPTPVAVHGVIDHTEGGVPNLANQLRESWALQSNGLLTSQEFLAKKAQLLAKPIRAGSLTSDLERISELLRERILTNPEFAAIKAKVLVIDN